LAATIRDQLSQPVTPLEYGSPRVRHLFSYFSVVVVVAIVIVTFFMIKIVPALNQIFEEFEIEAPESLQYSVRFTNVLSDYWYLFALAFLALWLVLFTSWPGRRLRMRLTSQFYRPARELRFASVLQSLSVATKAGRPIAGALSTLARYHFDPILRNQLLFIRNELDHGADVWQSMGNLGLLTIPEVRALESSEQMGDRAWVLQQLAQGKRRRLRWRLARWLELVLPAFVLLIGAFVLWQALSMFQSLTKLVYSLL
jgi:type II secretory pathway component PulF